MRLIDHNAIVSNPRKRRKVNYTASMQGDNLSDYLSSDPDEARRCFFLQFMFPQNILRE